MANAHLFLRGVETKPATTLLATASFLYDFNLAYELCRLTTDQTYEGFRFTHYVLFRDGRPLRERDRLRVVRLEQASPMKLETKVAIVSGTLLAVAAAVEIATKVADWPYDRHRARNESIRSDYELEKSQLEVRKLKRELGEVEPAKELDPQRLQIVIPQIIDGPAGDYVRQVGKRLERSPIRIEDVEIKIVSDQDGEKRK
jgi:hypothetical protein